MTVLFTDVSGFTAMSEKLDARVVRGIVNELFEVLCEPIYRYGGVVDKYIGDAVMALFGAPVAHEDDPERAVWAAFEMQRAAEVFAEELEAKLGIRLRLRVGLATGLVVTGAIGGLQKRDYTVIGDTVHLAQRMEGAARPGRILVTAETQRLTRHRFDYGRASEVAIAGKSAPVETYELLGPILQHGRMDETIPLVGRQAELGSLQAAYERASRGAAQLVTITGEAGMGKSRLVSTFLAACRPPIVLHAGCQSYTRHSSYGLVSDFLHHILGTTPFTFHSEIRAALEAQCRALRLADPERLMALVGEFLGLDVSGSEFASLSQEQRRRLALLELNRVLLRLAERHPMILVLEDLQWADEASLDWLTQFLDHLAHEASQARLLVVTEQRADASPWAWPSDLPGARLALLPLDGPERREFVARMLGVEPAAWSADLRACLEPVFDRSEGNPFFLHELVSALVEGGVLVSEAGGWHAAEAPSARKLPATLQGVIAARLDALPAAWRHTVQVASVLGRSFSQRSLERILDPGDHEATVSGLIKGGLLWRASSEELAFGQALIQEAAYQSLLISSRRSLHARAGSALEELYGDRLDEVAALIAHHHLHADDTTRALPYLHRAARRAFELFDLPAARRFSDQALELSETAAKQGDRWELLCLDGRIRTAHNELDQALEAFSQALACAPGPHARAQVLLAKGDVFDRQGQFAALQEVYQEAYDQLAAEEPALRASYLAKIGLARYRQGDYAASQACSLEALQLLPETGFERERGFAHSCIGLCLMRQGSYESAVHHTREALTYRQLAKDLNGVANSSSNLAYLYSTMGDKRLAEEYYRASLQAYERIGDAYWISLGRNNLATYLLSIGNLEEAETQLRQVLELQDRLETRQLRAIVRFNLGEVLSYRREYRAGLEHMQAAIAIFEELGAQEAFAEVYRSLGRCHAALGERAAAEACLEKALLFAEQGGDLLTPGVVARVRGQMALAAGDPLLAAERAREAIARLADREAPLELGRAYTLLAAAMPDSPEGQAARRQAEELFTRIEARLDLAELSAARAG